MNQKRRTTATTQHFRIYGGLQAPRIFIAIGSSSSIPSFSARNPSPRVLWADSICIDQTDGGLPERNAQVAVMGDIYRRAEDVLVWLGEGNQRSDAFLGHIQRLSQSPLALHARTSQTRNEPAGQDISMPGYGIRVPQVDHARSFWPLEHVWSEARDGRIFLPGFRTGGDDPRWSDDLHAILRRGFLGSRVDLEEGREDVDRWGGESRKRGGKRRVGGNEDLLEVLPGPRPPHCQGDRKKLGEKLAAAAKESIARSSTVSRPGDQEILSSTSLSTEPEAVVELVLSLVYDYDELTLYHEKEADPEGCLSALPFAAAFFRQFRGVFTTRLVFTATATTSSSTSTSTDSGILLGCSLGSSVAVGGDMVVKFPCAMSPSALRPCPEGNSHHRVQDPAAIEKAGSLADELAQEPGLQEFVLASEIIVMC
ncbi:hypothetical protein MKZ38_005384 [Zalerion maritima]|uniref:Heterokaryon incompatibility domain-containing protein n=1 Tax=Zalerion maritima TaxID=339359 RepID=A0AAD5RR18_9PEZI|nr:hypothetical protein MKZ38_005384 [Zalerion maritima]